MILCNNWYYLCNLKNVKNTHWGMLLLEKFQISVVLLKVTLLHGCISSFLNRTYGTKSPKASHLTLRQLPSPNLIKYLSHFSCNYGKDRLNKLISIPELSFRVAHPIHGLTAHHLKLVTYQTAAPNRLLIHCHFLKIKTSHNLTHIILVLHFIQKPVIWFYTPI